MPANWRLRDFQGKLERSQELRTIFSPAADQISGLSAKRLLQFGMAHGVRIQTLNELPLAIHTDQSLLSRLCESIPHPGHRQNVDDTVRALLGTHKASITQMLHHSFALLAQVLDANVHLLAAILSILPVKLVALSSMVSTLWAVQALELAMFICGSSSASLNPWLLLRNVHSSQPHCAVTKVNTCLTPPYAQLTRKHCRVVPGGEQLESINGCAFGSSQLWVRGHHESTNVPYLTNLSIGCSLPIEVHPYAIATSALRNQVWVALRKRHMQPQVVAAYSSAGELLSTFEMI